jgi:hypothetical protein
MTATGSCLTQRPSPLLIAQELLGMLSTIHAFTILLYSVGSPCRDDGPEGIAESFGIPGVVEGQACVGADVALEISDAHVILPNAFEQG